MDNVETVIRLLPMITVTEIGSAVTTTNEMPESLADKLFNAMPDELPWSMVEIQKAFPTETYWPLYRALNSLERERRIRFYKIIAKKKYYNKAKINDLPHITTTIGQQHPISVFVTQRAVDERGVWKQLDQKKVNRVPLLFAQLFVAANKLTGNEQRQEWSLIREELTEARAALVTAISWIDSVIDHPAMSGDMEKFAAVFGGKDAPSNDELNAYLRWANALVKSDQIAN